MIIEHDIQVVSHWDASKGAKTHSENLQSKTIAFHIIGIDTDFLRNFRNRLSFAWLIA